MLSGGFDAIDDWEWSKWMAHNGCKRKSLESAIAGDAETTSSATSGESVRSDWAWARLHCLALLLTYKV